MFYELLLARISLEHCVEHGTGHEVCIGTLYRLGLHVLATAHTAEKGKETPTMAMCTSSSLFSAHSFAHVTSSGAR